MILVTGSSGFIGSHLMRELEEDNQNCVALSTKRRDSSPSHPLLFWNLESQSSNPSIPREVETIVHLAQSPDYANFPESAISIFNGNLRFTANLLDAAKSSNVRRFIYVSTAGISHSSQINEVVSGNYLPANLDSLDFYYGSKFGSEYLAYCYRKYFHIIVLRLNFVFGTGQRSNFLIPRIISMLKSGSPIKLESEKGPLMNPIHVSEVTRIIRMCEKESFSGLYLVGGRQKVFLEDIIKFISQRMGVMPAFTRGTGPSKNLTVDIKSTLAKFGDTKETFWYHLAETVEEYTSRK